MKHFFLILFCCLICTSVSNSQTIHIQTKSETDTYDFWDIDSIGIINVEPDAPIIYSLNPNWGEIGDTISINGKNFLEKNTISTTYLLFAESKILPLNWNDTLITMIIPEGVDHGYVQVVVRNKASNKVSLSVVEQKENPEIFYIDPPYAEISDTIHIEGSYFGEIQDQLYFEDIEVENYISWSDTLIVLKVPEGVSTGMVYVKREGIKSKGRYFEILRLPKVTSMTPTSGFVADTVIISGKNFGNLRWANKLYFNNVEVSNYSEWNDKFIKVLVPEGASTGNVKMRVDGYEANCGVFTVKEKPYITMIRPIAGFVGDTVDIYGTKFGKTQENSTISFNDVYVIEYINWTNKYIRVIIPENAITGLLNGIVGEAKTNSIQFEVLSKKTICGECIDTDGNSYKTIRIGSQCWMAENLNVGVQIDSTEDASNNDIIEKWCYEDSTENCNKYGGLYTIHEVLGWNTTTVGQGICPSGWRVSNDYDWQVLEREIGMPEEELVEDGRRGTDQALKLKEGGTTNFDALYSGLFWPSNNTYAFQNIYSDHWSPDVNQNVFYDWYRSIRVTHNYIDRSRTPNSSSTVLSLSVRCIKTEAAIIDSIYPNIAYDNDYVVIFGKNLGNSKNYGRVLLNDKKIDNIISWRETEIHLRLNKTLVSGELCVELFGGKSNSKYLSLKPWIDSIAPQNADVGERISIHGRYFGENNGVSKLLFNSIEIDEIISWKDSEIRFVVPKSSGVGRIYVTNDSLKSHGYDFRINISCGQCIDADGRSYRTVLLGDQCWMGEALKIGTMIADTIDQTNNGLIEKYCKDNDPSNCDKNGALYQWWELMQFTEEEGAKGICPEGWHIPLDEEWKDLERNLGMPESEVNKLWEQTRGGEKSFDSFIKGGLSGMEIILGNRQWTSSKSDTKIIFRSLFHQDDWIGFLRNLSPIYYKCHARCIRDK